MSWRFKGFTSAKNRPVLDDFRKLIINVIHAYFACKLARQSCTTLTCIYDPMHTHKPAGSNRYYYRRLSSKFDEFLDGRPQFDSYHGVDFYTPTCCQSATFERPFLRFIALCFYEKIKMRHFATDAVFTLRDWWICVIHKFPCANDGATALRHINR